MIYPEIAKRYAAGLFYTTTKHGVIDQVSGEQKGLTSLLKKQPKFKNFLEMPQIPSKEKREIVKRIFEDRLHPVFYHYLILLLGKHRSEYLTVIADEYEKLVKEHMGIVQAKVTTAISLDKEVAGKLRNKLEKKIGKKIEMLLDVNPAIIGGITLILGNQIIDNSIRHYLTQLKEQMLEIEVH